MSVTYAELPADLTLHLVEVNPELVSYIRDVNLTFDDDLDYNKPSENDALDYLCNEVGTTAEYDCVGGQKYGHFLRVSGETYRFGT